MRAFIRGSKTLKNWFRSAASCNARVKSCVDGLVSQLTALHVYVYVYVKVVQFEWDAARNNITIAESCETMCGHV